jgi:poly-gamma-glutamate capsule biosynthesis protein CapA/YwtB (metallophosphatase superfamily)
MRKRSLQAGGALLLAVVVASVVASIVASYAIRRSARWSAAGPPAGLPAAALTLPPSGPLTIVAAGDTIISRPIARSESDEAFDAIIGVVRGASVAITNLEMNLLGSAAAGTARGTAAPRWTFGSAAEAAELRRLGFDVVGQANNHATDYGSEGMLETRAILVESGLIPAGSGRDLAEASAPVLVGRGARKIAVLAVAISSRPESIATPARGIITGRPGINPLRFAADVTVDGPTYETLRRSAPALQGGDRPGSDQFTLFGTAIKKGEQTSVNLVPDARDIAAILAQVGRAREIAEVVVLSVHSHEPSNGSDPPAEFFRSLARQAIDAGAALVVGHGPHRLRGVEVYKSGAILYSVGNFLYRLEGESPATDPYDAGLDMYSLATGIPGAGAAGAFGAASEEWWEGAVAVATFEAGGLRSLQVHPVDLGGDLPADRRGIPRKPVASRAVRILERLTRLSRPYDTTIRIVNGVATIDLE